MEEPRRGKEFKSEVWRCTPESTNSYYTDLLFPTIVSFCSHSILSIVLLSSWAIHSSCKEGLLFPSPSFQTCELISYFCIPSEFQIHHHLPSDLRKHLSFKHHLFRNPFQSSPPRQIIGESFSLSLFQSPSSCFCVIVLLRHSHNINILTND